MPACKGGVGEGGVVMRSVTGVGFAAAAATATAAAPAVATTRKGSGKGSAVAGAVTGATTIPTSNSSIMIEVVGCWLLVVGCEGARDAREPVHVFERRVAREPVHVFERWP